MQRIMIIGSGGAGKSMVAQQLGRVLKLPVIHLDSLYWKPHWKKTSPEEWREIQHTIVRGRSWIIDGNYRSTMDIRLAAADTVIFLDYPKLLCLWRVMKRRFQYHRKTRRDLGGNNYERTTWEFIRWILSYPRHEVMKKLTPLYASKTIIHLRRPKDLHNFLATLRPI